MIIHSNKKKAKIEARYTALVTSVQDQLYRMAYGYVHNREDALDIVQDTIYKGYISYHKVKEPAYERTWITRILINTALDFIKKQKRILPMEMEHLTDEKQEVEKTHDKLILKEALDKLDGQEKAIIMMRYFEDIKLSEIAETLKLPLSTIKSKMYRALKKMQIELGEEML